MNRQNWQDLISKFRYQILLVLIGAILIGAGILFSRSSIFTKPKIEVLNATTVSQDSTGSSQLVVEISGAVEKPGVYKLPFGSRVEDLLIIAGGVSADANRALLDKNLNRAAKLSDGQKLYIPYTDEQSAVLSANTTSGGSTISNDSTSTGQKLININTSSREELETLWGIGPVTAQKVIEQRPYSSVEELLTKKVLKQNVYDKIKDQLTIY